MNYSEIIKTCFTKADFCRALGVKPIGGNYRRIDKIIEDNNLDISHFRKEP